jgi:hypothetical protein
VILISRSTKVPLSGGNEWAHLRGLDPTTKRLRVPHYIFSICDLSSNYNRLVTSLRDRQWAHWTSDPRVQPAYHVARRGGAAEDEGAQLRGFDTLADKQLRQRYSDRCRLLRDRVPRARREAGKLHATTTFQKERRPDHKANNGQR